MFFPQLIAGPIVRGQYFKKQLQKKNNFNSQSEFLFKLFSSKNKYLFFKLFTWLS